MTSVATAPWPSDGLPEIGLRRLRPIAKRLGLRRWDIHELGADQVPAEGPVILASNHIGWLDGPLMIAGGPRPAHALVKSEMFVGRVGRLLRFAGQISVRRDQVDAGAVRRAVRALRAGQAVVMYPEGSRGAGEFEQIKPGVAYLALVTGAPIVPVAIFGTRQAGEPADARPATGARIDVAYGTPLTIEATPWPRDTTSVATATETIRTALVDHIVWAKSVLKRDLPGPLPKGSTDE